MSAWFFMLGEGLADFEREQARHYLSGLGLPEAPVEAVADFAAAARVISHPDWDRGWWDAEQRERQRLLAVTAAQGQTDARRASSQSALDSMEATHGAAAVQAARLGGGDPGLIRAAAGCLDEALHLASLAERAGVGTSHPFILKRALFAGGHWPLAVVAGRFYVF